MFRWTSDVRPRKVSSTSGRVRTAKGGSIRWRFGAVDAPGDRPALEISSAAGFTRAAASFGSPCSLARMTGIRSWISATNLLGLVMTIVQDFSRVLVECSCHSSQKPGKRQRLSVAVGEVVGLLAGRGYSAIRNSPRPRQHFCLNASRKNGLMATVSARVLNAACFISLSGLFHHGDQAPAHRNEITIPSATSMSCPGGAKLNRLARVTARPVP